MYLINTQMICNLKKQSYEVQKSVPSLLVLLELHTREKETKLLLSLLFYLFIYFLSSPVGMNHGRIKVLVHPIIYCPANFKL